MTDDEQSRDEQADDEKRRQRERMQEEARTRTDEEEPMRVDSGERLGDLDEALESHEYPATTTELVEAYGDYEVETQGGKKPMEDVLSATDDEIYDSAEDVHRRILTLIE
ncbi:MULTISPECIES: DUF5789 family protein [Halolamina]|uniref:DUF2795 domain-containing protein n=1 Tax=Halolamina pelagica TaxID=699431 RepID=A0A1I5ULA2_9EURY|nr:MULTISPECIES: hypothetical protein [Halolamina]NHX37589.1 hypothetical protein [Halolamina sp. R1-12]SFP96010.1 hypothetical protein SAMN05216277_11326 [Halolamina pelagica]